MKPAITVRRKRMAGQYIQALDLAGQIESRIEDNRSHSLDDAEALSSCAELYVDLGYYHKAQIAYQRAAKFDPSNKWYTANAFENAYRAKAVRSRTSLATVRARIVSDIDAEANKYGRRADRLPLIWCKARIYSGIEPDERPTKRELDEADQILSTATTLVDARSNEAVPLVLARIRVARSRVAMSLNRAIDLQKAWTQIEDYRALLESADAVGLISSADVRRDSLDYETARLHLLDNDPTAAVERLESVLRRRPSHQAARVWLLHARRVCQSTRSARDALIEEIDSVIPRLDASRKPIVDARPNLVYTPELLAELFAQKAVLLRQSSLLSAAEAEYRVALEFRPRMIFAHRGLAYCLVDRGDTSGAREQLSLAESTQSPHHVSELDVDRGRLEHRLGRFRNAIALYDRAIERSPQYGFAYEAKTRALRASGDHHAAVQVAERARSSGARALGGMHIEIASTVLSRGDLDATESATRNRAASTIDRHIALAKNEPSGRVRNRARAMEGRYLFELRRLDQCERLVSEPDRAGDVAEVYALVLGESGRYSRALELQVNHYENFKDNENLQFRARFGRGVARTFRALGQPAKALQVIDAELEVARRSVEHRLLLGAETTNLRVERGWALMDVEDFHAAYREFSSVLFSRNDHDSAFRGRLLALGHLGKDAHTLEYEARRWIANNSDKGRYAAGAILTELGRVFVHQGSVRTAYELFEEANRSSYNFSQRVVQVQSLIEHRALMLARTQLEQLRQLATGRFSSDPVVRILEGWLKLEQRSPSGALTVYEELLSDFEDSESALLGRAAARLELGMCDEVVSDLEGILTKYPENVVAAELLMWAHIRSHERWISAGTVNDEALRRARDLCAHVRRRAPHRIGTISGMGFIAAQNGDTRDAETYFRSAIVDCYRNEVHGDRWAGGHRFDVARPGRPTVPHIGKHSAALDRLDEALFSPFSDTASRELDDHWLNSGRSSALTHKRAVTWRDLGALYYQAGRFDHSVLALERALKLQPSDARCRLLLGAAYHELGRESSAMVHMRASVGIVREVENVCALSLRLVGSGRHRDAIELLNESLTVLGSDDHCYRLYAARAHALYRLAMKDRQRSEAVLRSAASDMAHAEELLRRPKGIRGSVNNNRALRDIVYSRGVILQALGRSEAARKAFSSAANDPTDIDERALLALDLIGGDSEAPNVESGTSSWVHVVGALAAAVAATMGARLLITAFGIGPESGLSPLVASALFGGSMGALLVIALLPRLVGLRVPKYVEIDLAVGPSIEWPAEVELDYAEPPLLTMRGPSAQRSLPFSSDIEWPPST